MEDDSSLIQGLKNDPLSIIDEKPELTTLVLATKLQKDDKSSLSDKILSKLSKGYTCFTVMKIMSYSLAEMAFILPYCLKKVGIVPYCFELIIISLISFFFFYIHIDVVIKFNLFHNYQGILKQNLSRKFNLLNYLINLLYHSLLLILQIYIIFHFILKLLSLFGIDLEKNFIYFLIILLGLILFHFSLSFFSFLTKPDMLYIFFIIFFIFLNITSLVFFLIYKFKNEFNNSEEKENKLTDMNFFEKISTDYFVCFSVLINIIAWQSQISRHLEEFKIKTTRRFFNILYLTVILQILFCIITGLINTPLMKEDTNKNNEYKLKLFIIDYNEEVIPILMIKIVLIFFCFLINILISHRIKLIEENFILVLNLIIYNSSSNTKKLNKILIALFKLVILLLCVLINLVINDITYIIIIFGGILASILNFSYPTVIYWKLISKNNLAIRIALGLSLIVIFINLIGLILKILFELII